jgi:hypothetical protein
MAVAAGRVSCHVVSLWHCAAECRDVEWRWRYLWYRSGSSIVLCFSLIRKREGVFISRLQKSMCVGVD